MIVVAALEGGIPHGHQGGNRRRQAQARGQAPPRLFPATSIPPRIARGTPLLIPDAGGTLTVAMTKVMLRGNGKRFHRDRLLMSGSHDDRTRLRARIGDLDVDARFERVARQSALPITSSFRWKRDDVEIVSSFPSWAIRSWPCTAAHGAGWIGPGS